MNPLYRKMFRDPRAAKRATGILASSAPLMTAAQKAMSQGQPVKAQTGFSVRTQPVVPSSVMTRAEREALALERQRMRASPQFRIEEYRPMRPNLPASVLSQLTGGVGDVDFGRLGRSLEASLAAPVFAAPGTAAAMSPMQRDAYDKSRGELRRQGNPMLRRGPTDVAPAGSGITSVAPATTQYPVGSTIDFSSAGPSDMLSRNASDVAPEGRSQGLSALEKARMRAAADLAKSADTSTSTSSVPTGSGEQLSSMALIDAEIEKRANEKTEAEGVAGARQKELAENPMLRRGPMDVAPKGTGPETPEEKAAKPTPESAAQSQNQEAKQNDKNIGIDPKLSRKERVEARYELLKGLLGEDKAKDVRTDANYNLMMLGLRIAAGQSEDALQNIAVGAGQQLEAFGEAKGEQQQAAAEREDALKLQAVNEVSAEISAEEQRQFETDQRIGSESFQRDMQDTRLGAERAMRLVDRNWQAAQKTLDRDLTRETAAAEETFRLQLARIQSEVAAEDRQAAYDRLVMTHDFQSRQAAEGRLFDLDKLLASQEFAREQGISDQAFRIQLAKFTASLPTGTQALYEKYLKPEQIAGVIMAGVTGNTAKAPSQEAFALQLLENPDAYDSIKRDIANSFDPPLDPKTVTRDQVIDGIGAMYNQIKNYVAPASN